MKKPEIPMKKPEEKIPQAPQGRSPEARRFWQRILRAWDLNPGELFVLAQACEALDELRAAEAIVGKEGMVFTDRFGQKKVHPAVLVARDSRILLLKALRQLGLRDEEAIKAQRKPGRPERTYPQPA